MGDRKKMEHRSCPVMSGVKGIDRVVEVGKSMEFGFVWDGYDLRERLTRRVMVEVEKAVSSGTNNALGYVLIWGNCLKMNKW